MPIRPLDCVACRKKFKAHVTSEDGHYHKRRGECFKKCEACRGERKQPKRVRSAMEKDARRRKDKARQAAKCPEEMDGE